MYKIYRSSEKVILLVVNFLVKKKKKRKKTHRKKSRRTHFHLKFLHADWYESPRPEGGNFELGVDVCSGDKSNEIHYNKLSSLVREYRTLSALRSQSEGK